MYKITITYASGLQRVSRDVIKYAILNVEAPIPILEFEVLISDILERHIIPLTSSVIFIMIEELQGKIQ